MVYLRKLKQFELFPRYFKKSQGTKHSPFQGPHVEKQFFNFFHIFTVSEQFFSQYWPFSHQNSVFYRNRIFKNPQSGHLETCRMQKNSLSEINELF
jgi:hypothetical protein